MQISVRQIEELDRRFSGMKNQVKRVKEKADKTVQQVVRTGELGGTAFAFGIVNGRWQSPELLGVPVDLGTALLAHGAAFMGIAEEHLHNIGDGALASYLTALGQGVGVKMLQEQKEAAARLAAANV